MYDIPVKPLEQARELDRFRKNLEFMGFERLQYSVYKRFCGSRARLTRFQRQVQAVLPKEGEVRLLTFTDRQYGEMIIYECDLLGGPKQLKEPSKQEQYVLF